MKDPTPLRRAGYAIAILALFLLAALPSAAAAQTLYGSVVGNVTDGQGATVPGASVTLINTGTNLRRETVTDAQGAYNFINVLAGPYDVKIALQGFREAVRTGVPVTVGQISRVDMTLEIGAMTETVTVKSEAELLQTDKSDVKTELKADEIVNLPLNQFRNYQALVVLVPGSLPPTLQNAETDTPQRSLAMTVNGQSGNANTTMTDGTRSVNVAMQHHELYIQPAETIETVTVTTGSMDAEQGMAAGAAITVTTKSGTNTFKGSAFEFFNNEKLNANPFYFGRGAVPAKLPVERQTFGGTLGGPILRNRLFFFGSYEGYRSKTNRYTFYTVPDAALRSGDFSNALNTNGTVQRIYDPMTGDMSTGTGRAQFANNVIPASRFNPIARTLLALYPMPNVEGTGAGNLTNNYRVQQKASTIRHNVDAKVNWNRTPAHQFWGKYSEMRAVVDDLFTFPIGESDDDGGHTNTYQVTAGQTWSIGPTLLLDSSFGILFNDQFVSSPDFHLGNIGLDLGIPGTNDQGRSDPRYAGMPQFSTGFTALGNTPTWSPIYMDQRDASFTTNVTKVSGKHDVRAGYAATYMKLDYWQPENANPRGSFTFASNATRTFGTGRADGELLQPVRRLPARPRRHRRQELSVRALHDERMAARAVRARSVDSEPEAHARPRRAVGVLPGHDARRAGHRDARPEDARRADWRPGRQPEEHGPRGAAGRVRAAGRRGLPPQREDRASKRLRPDLRRAGDGRAGGVRGLPAVSARAQRQLPAPGGTGQLRLVRHVEPGHPAARGAGHQQRPRAAAERHRHADRRAGNDAPRQDAFVERRVRTAPPARLGGRRVCRQQARRRPGPDQRQSRPDARRRRGRSSVLRLARPAEPPSTCTGRTSGPTTTRCRSA